MADDLKEALTGCNLVYGTSARSRTLSWPVKTARECAEQVSIQRGEIAFVFGRERSGLTNEELSLCHYHVTIPTDRDFSSLNLAQAVQIITYEIRTATMLITIDQKKLIEAAKKIATVEQMVGFYTHLKKTLIELKFIGPKQPEMLMNRLKRLFNRAQIDETELNILRGILSAVHKRGNC